MFLASCVFLIAVEFDQFIASYILLTEDDAMKIIKSRSPEVEFKLKSQ